MNIDVIKRRVLASRKKADLLLDEFPNAAAAYSLRLLNSEYTGDCIEVRRSSDDALQNIGFLNGEVDTASLLSFVGAGDGFVRTWYDQSGNSGRNGVNTTNANQPQIVNNGSLITEGGNPSLLFNGTNNWLIINNFQVSSYTNISVLSVHKATITTGIRGIFGKFQSQNNQRSFFFAVRDGNFSGNFHETGSSQPLRIESSGVIVNDYQLSALLFRGDQPGGNINKVDYYKNSNLTSKTLVFDNINTSLFNPNINFNIGNTGGNSSFYFEGNISEVIFYEFSQFDNIPSMHNLSNQYYNIF